MNTELIDEIRIKTDIVDIIGNYIPLTSRGKNYFGVCPFHEDHHPSMSVSKDKQIYKCFSCGASGNVFQFVMDYENIGFGEAVRILGEKVGVKVTANTKVSQKSASNQKLYDIYEDAFKYYVNNLHSKEGLNARKYLEQRQLKVETINHFGIGLALNKSAMLANFLKQKYEDLSVLLQSGLMNNDYDTFQNRIMFPYEDLEGKVVAFSGRIYQSDDPSKYINTKETSIFKKGELLYNYHRAKNKVRQQRSVLVVEGVMDVIRLYEAGFENVVAIMGSSITSHQMQLLKRMSANIIMCLDGDAAGEKGMLLATQEASKLGIRLNVLKLPEGDPDTYLLKNGPEKFKLLMSEAMSDLDYKVQILAKEIKSSDMVTIRKYLDHFKEDIELLKNDPIVQNVLLQKLSEKTGVEQIMIKDSLTTNIKPVEKTEKIDHPEKKDKISRAEIFILNYMMQDPLLIDKVVEAGVYFYHPAWRDLFDEIILYADQNDNFEMADFITSLLDKPKLLKRMQEVLSYNYPEKYDEQLIFDCMDTINDMNKDKIIREWSEELKETMDVDLKIELANKIYDMKVGND